MEITLNITEDSKVQLVKDSCEAVQGEHNVTILNINFPSTIKGYSIDNYSKQIEFGECKELGECQKFFDVLEGNTYKLCSICTQFKKLLIQFTLKNLVDEAEPIVWKTIPVALEFNESINAENSKEAQVALLSLAEIEKDWENYIKANTFRVISKVGDMPTADATTLGDTIFYLGANSTSPYTLTYGHYYKCNYINNAYEWTDLTQDPSLEGVANGVREINKNQTIQFWVGDTEELKNEVAQPNVAYIPLNYDIKKFFDTILNAMASDENYNLLYPLIKEHNLFKYIATDKVSLNIGGELQAYGDYAYLEMSSPQKIYKIGDTFSYQGETAEITEYSELEANAYTIRVANGGVIHAAKQSTIEVDDNITTTIPQVKTIWSGSVTPTVQNSVEVNTNITLSADTLEAGDFVEIEWFIDDYSDDKLVSIGQVNAVGAFIGLSAVVDSRDNEIVGITSKLISNTEIYIGSSILNKISVRPTITRISKVIR